MIVERVVMENWMGYAGRTELELGPTLYAVTAQYDGDARRSNWAGKTSLIEAMRFAFFGKARAATVDGWITVGATGGSVEVTLSGGVRVKRWRGKGHATRLSVTEADGSVSADGAAQQRLEELLGLSQEDFDVTCWFGQKQMARLITARPGDRFELISGWFGLGKLQQAEAAAVANLRSMLSKQQEVERRIADARAVIGSVRERYPEMIMSTGDEFALLLAKAAQVAQESATVAERALLDVRETLRAFEQARGIEADRERLAAIQARGRAVVEELKGYANAEHELSMAQAALEYAASASALVGQDYANKKVLASGRFDGCCPVDERECPVKAEINGRRDSNAALLGTAKAAFADATEKEAVARQRATTATASNNARLRLETELAQLRAQAKPLVERTRQAAGWTLDRAAYDKAEHALREAEVAHREAMGQVRDVGLDLGTVQVRLAHIAEQAQEAAAITSQVAVARMAVRILGRQGAQRVISEEALAEIEAGANEMLRAAGIDLGVRVVWAKEGSGLAKVCAECGTAFAAKAKVCGACGAERGHNVIERLEVELTDTSGAAEDLAGAALQLSAAAWLRRERGAALCTAFLDEPFGALDEANRKAFAAHLVSLLQGASGFQQAFIVAHHPDVLDGLPGRILVTRSASGSTASVV